MAQQNPYPSSWFETDGCSGVADFTAAIKAACDKHDVGYHWGGATSPMKQRVDWDFYLDLQDAGWLGARLAFIRYTGVRRLTWNHPPPITGPLGVRQARYSSMLEALRHGQFRIEAWNWLGPGRGEHAGLPAQRGLLLIQEYSK